MSIALILILLASFGVWVAAWRRYVMPAVTVQARVDAASIPYGGTVTMSIVVRNPSPFPAPFVTSTIVLPEGLSTVDPLAMREPSFEAKEEPGHIVAFSAGLRRKEELTASFTLYGTRRGPQRVHEMDLQLSDGLTTKRTIRKLPCHVDLIVHPRIIQGPARKSHETKKLGMAQAERKLFASSLDWIDLRPYQLGDSFRDIAWPVSARRGELIVLERSMTIHREVILVVNVQVKEETWYEGNTPVVESIYELAYQTALSLLNNETLLHIYANSAWRQEDPGRGHRILTVQGPLQRNTHALLGHAIGRLPSLAHIRLAALLQEIARRYTSPVQIVLCSDLPPQVAQKQWNALRALGHQLTWIPPTVRAYKEMNP